MVTWMWVIYKAARLARRVTLLLLLMRRAGDEVNGADMPLSFPVQALAPGVDSRNDGVMFTVCLSQ